MPSKRSTTHPSAVGKEVRHGLAEEHKVARAAHRVDSDIAMAEVVASGNPRRMERYLFRKLAYKYFAKFMAKITNRM